MIGEPATKPLTQGVPVKILGMESEHCAGIISDTLKVSADVTNYSVELNNRRAVVQLRSNFDALKNVVKSIIDVGYEVPTVKRVFQILGMTCASCSQSVESITRAQPGVVDANVNFAASTLAVEYLAEATSPDGLKTAVEQIGYSLLIDEESAEKDKDQAEEKRYNDLKLSVIASGVLSVPIVIIGMFFMDMPFANIIMMVLSVPVLGWFGRRFFITSWKQIRHGVVSMDTLVAVSTGTAFLFSTAVTLFPTYMMSVGVHTHVYFEAAVVIIFFISIGKMLEERAKKKTGESLRQLIGEQPSVVRIEVDGQETEVPIKQVAKGTIVIARPGEKLAVDGVVVRGSSYVNESLLTGEPLPALKTISDEVFAGTINQDGVLYYEAKSVGAQTVLQRIVGMVQQAQASKAPVQHVVDKISRIFVPAVIGISILAFVVWLAVGGMSMLPQAVVAAVSVLIIACPCALGLATPSAIMAAVGKGAKQNILISNAESLQAAYKATTILLDKTGTITEGEPQVVELIWNVAEDAELKAALSALEVPSTHPISKAIVKYLDVESGDVVVEDYENVRGKGVRANVNNKVYVVGSMRYAEEIGVTLSAENSATIVEWGNRGYTVSCFVQGEKVLALIAVSDVVKTSSVEAVKQFIDMGLRVAMLTGDNSKAAEWVGGVVGITEIYSELLPGEKEEIVAKLQGEGRVVAMIGDGINDSQALARADVSIAMGKGSDVAMDVAGITLTTSDLRGAVAAIALSRLTIQTIHQNLFWAFAYNIVGIPIAAGVLYPFTGTLLSPMIAAAAMALSSVSVVVNTNRKLVL
ncbi:MAG: copper-translocating P-type ATPase [Ignavibacteria bacterium]|nr:copper-translocating P-type ATPase [Ignavibacteria bacterium]